MMSFNAEQMNMGGPSFGPGTSEARRKYVLNHVNSDIVFGQECPGPSRFPKNLKPEYKIFYNTHNNCIIYNTNIFDIGQTDLGFLYPISVNLTRRGLLCGSEIYSRVLVCEGSAIGPRSFEAIFASYHGYHTGKSKDVKIQLFKDLMVYVQSIRARRELPVIVGGDFNLDYKLVLDLLPPDIHLYYTGDAPIDYFLICNAGQAPCSLQNVHRVPRPGHVMVNGKTISYNQLFDHPQVAGSLQTVSRSIRVQPYAKYSAVYEGVLAGGARAPSLQPSYKSTRSFEDFTAVSGKTFRLLD